MNRLGSKQLSTINVAMSSTKISLLRLKTKNWFFVYCYLHIIVFDDARSSDSHQISMNRQDFTLILRPLSFAVGGGYLMRTPMWLAILATADSPPRMSGEAISLMYTLETSSTMAEQKPHANAVTYIMVTLCANTVSWSPSGKRKRMKPQSLVGFDKVFISFSWVLLDSTCFIV